MSVKKILVISANPMSKIFNNGKTLNAFFDSYPKEKLAQLFFSAEIPDSDICSSYYRISDIDMLSYRLRRKNTCGEIVAPVEGKRIQTDADKTAKKIRKSNFTRLMREFVWNSKWLTTELQDWLDSFRPEVVFFLAGDVVFAHKICNYIVKKYNIPMAMYITDDYILPRYNIDVFGHIRRRLIRKYMRKSINRTNALFVISESMRKCYRKIYGKDSFVAANMHEHVGTGTKGKENRDIIEIVYAGGLHYNRHLTVLQVCQAIRNINSRKERDAKRIILKIFSGSSLNPKEMDRLLWGDCCIWGGLLGSIELEQQLERADYLLHVESFKKSNICDTKLSLSTKIPEYMSYRKPIIAIGPSEVASMSYLEDCACCITDLHDIEEKLERVVFHEQQGKILANLAYEKYLENHDKKKIQPKIIEIINNMSEEKA